MLLATLKCRERGALQYHIQNFNSSAALLRYFDLYQKQVLVSAYTKVAQILGYYKLIVYVYILCNVVLKNYMLTTRKAYFSRCIFFTTHFAFADREGGGKTDD
jgi:hypothetical protein